MKKMMKVMVLFSLGFVFLHAGNPTSDSRAGYHDGCRSARGHYTRSDYKYKHVAAYHRQWRKGRRACARKTVRKRHIRRVKATHSRACNTEVSWQAFRRGWQHGNRSARGHFYVDRRGCAAYRQGWVNGYRDCHCGDHQKPNSYASGYAQGCNSVYRLKIRDDLYYRASHEYRHGWQQGYRDCHGIYK